MSPLSVVAPSKQHFSGAPIDQNPDVLKKGCFPPRPDKESSPEYYAAWESIARRPLQFIIPEILQWGPLAETRNWAGAILPVRQREAYNIFQIPQSGPFKAVVGSWDIPNPYPQRDTDGSYKDGEYRFYSWVGIDGWQNAACLKIGVVSMLDVKGGVIVSRGHYPAILMRGRSDNSIKVVVLKNLQIESGDYLTGFVWSEDDGRSGYGCIINNGTGQYSCARVDGGDEIFIEGLSAEWIGASENPSPNSHPAPDFGAMFFANGIALHRSFEEAGMSRGLLANSVDIKSTAKRPHTVVIYGQGWVPPPVIY